ncbi:hypothetical protein Cgig2_027160 [Carnegiea gigantea]|uniref:Uncharacterized protein n=1 Tax=Carnegiea gigantea TaxID=171969 RepID=A0A9Q1QNE1_9CARY|nr:hypothetical protein Cgig2_027160 [Carnegiea gigantea]
MVEPGQHLTGPLFRDRSDQQGAWAAVYSSSSNNKMLIFLQDFIVGGQGDNDWPLGRAFILLTLFGSFKDSGCPLNQAIKLSTPWRHDPSGRPMGCTAGSFAPCGGHKHSEEIMNIRVPRGVSSFPPLAFLYKERAGFFARGHLITLSTPPRERSRLGSFLFLHHGFSPFRDIEEMASYVRETFRWHLRGALRPSQPLLKNYKDLCLRFTLSDTEEAVSDFNIPEMVQATFYAMVVNDALELDAMSRDMASPKGLQWLIFESWLRINKHALLGAQLHGQANPEVGPGPASGQQKSSGSSDASPSSSDDE